MAERWRTALWWMTATAFAVVMWVVLLWAAIRVYEEVGMWLR